jgi:hypothetical protein
MRHILTFEFLQNNNNNNAKSGFTLLKKEAGWFKTCQKDGGMIL